MDLISKGTRTMPGKDLADPKMDLVFRKIFGEKGREHIVKSFLNSVLNRTEKIKTIEKIEYISNSLLPTVIGDRECIIDVHCKDEKDHQYVIEMQVATQDYFIQRSVYYTSGALVRQLKKGEKFDKVKKVHLVAVLNFTIFDHTKHCITHHAVFDRDDKNAETHPWIEFTYIELPKFDKITADQALTDADRWVMFFTQAHQEGILKQLSERVDEIEDACSILDYQNWLEVDQAVYENRIKKELDMEAQISTAEQKGIEKGIEKGLEKGLEKGKKETKIDLARNMLKEGLSIDRVAKIANLPVDTVKRLVKK